jgi:hypothetical protein
MTNFLIWLNEWIKDPKNQRNLTIVVALIVIILMQRCSPSKSEMNTLQQNVFALNDSLRSYQTRNGRLIYEQGALIADKKSLKDYNEKLYAEIQYLKDHPIVVLKPEIRIVEIPKYIPVYPGNPVYNADGTKTQDFFWKYDTIYSEGNYRNIEGSYTINVDSLLNLKTSPLHIKKDLTGVSLTTGLTENRDGKLEIFVTSKYPGFEVSRLDGALIDPAKSDILKKYFPPKRWALGFYGGFGPYIDPFNQKIGMGAQIGIGLQYNLIQWNFRK